MVRERDDDSASILNRHGMPVERRSIGESIADQRIALIDAAFFQIVALELGYTEPEDAPRQVSFEPHPAAQQAIRGIVTVDAKTPSSVDSDVFDEAMTAEQWRDQLLQATNEQFGMAA